MHWAAMEGAPHVIRELSKGHGRIQAPDLASQRGAVIEGVLKPAEDERKAHSREHEICCLRKFGDLAEIMVLDVFWEGGRT